VENLFRKVATDIALKAGHLLKELLRKEKRIGFKGEIDLVTQADLQSEELILAELSRNFPNHDILSEEKGNRGRESDFVWLIDPLDGTTNYAHNYPVFAVSIALEIKGEIKLAVVYDPNLEELFVAEKGKGATLNGKQIKVSSTSTLNQSLLATGFPYTIRQKPEPTLSYFKSFSLKAQGIRRLGSAALDLCALACGRIDGYWEAGLKPWDTAAGSLIVTEAGGQLSKFDGSPFDIYTPEILATNGHIHRQMLTVLASENKSQN
jgi:myo-inositol-1(or 4)-monophosphatase